jgi:cyclohexa-1,5-dienecarbonyl-CoA hydratase
MATQVTSRFSRLALEYEACAARIVLQHPPLNVIDFAMMDELGAALAEVEARPEVGAIVIGAAGKAFSVGVDVSVHTPEQVAAMLEKFHAVIRKIVSCKKVTIAQVQGHALGGGAELAMVCDLVYTADSAQWGFPEIKLGCYPPVACTALAALVGQKKAADLVLTGRTLTGSEATTIGLANLDVPVEQLREAVQECLNRVAKLSTAALAVTKKAFYAWDAMHFDKGLARAEKIYLEELMKTEDAAEGIRAFMEKREAQWKGR